MTATARRAMRIPEPLWLKALEVTRENQTTVTAVVIGALEDYTTPKSADPNGTLPDTPALSGSTPT